LFIGAHYQITDGTVTKYYFAGASRIAMRTGSTLTYLLTDHLGSTSLVTNASGALVSELRYKAWGEKRYSSGTTATNYRYTGQREESSFGLYFYNARWVDVQLGRFVQADSIVPGGVQGLDRYAYTFNNPLRYTDPSGHYCLEPAEARGHRVVNLCLTDGGQRLLDFSKKFNVDTKDVITAGLAGESSGWANNSDVMKDNVNAWGNRYQWYVDRFCGGFDVPNCELNFFMNNSQSVRDLVNKNWD
jgi:RHS repeat-associated protein